MNPKHEQLITGRSESCFRDDLEANAAAIKANVEGRRIAVIGAAGSIGASVVKSVLRFEPRALALIDISENNLVELVRDLRSSLNVTLPRDFVTLPIAMGSIEFARFFAENEPFDYLFNLAAMKHVRSEKDIYSLTRMIDTNVAFPFEFLEKNPYAFKKVFMVSSDKAANPANLMGATKMAMEKMLLYRSGEQPFSTARFANVAFSDGSLPDGFSRRIAKRQPIAAPNDIRRYFISHQEAGELCVLAAFVGENRDVFFPKLTARSDEKTFAEIAESLLRSHGYEPYLCLSEDEAKRRAEELIKQKKWPCCFFATDTSGEKTFEEFYVSSETVDLNRFQSIGVIQRDANDVDASVVKAFLRFVGTAKTRKDITKADYVRELERIVPTLSHVETGKNLDGKM